MFTLIGDGQALTRMFLGLPAGGDLVADTGPQLTLLTGVEVGIEPVEQHAGHALVPAQLRAARRLGWMSHQYRLDVQTGDQRQHVI